MVHNQQVYTNKCNDKRNCWIIWISLEDKYMKEKELGILNSCNTIFDPIDCWFMIIIDVGW